MSDLDTSIGKLIPLLGSNHPGEVIAAVAAIGRVLATHKLDWHDLAAAFNPYSPTDSYWRDTVAYCTKHLDRLNDKERDFISNLAHRTNKPSDKQIAWLDAIALKLRGQQS